MKCTKCENEATTETHDSISEMDVRGAAKICFDAEEGVVFLHEELN